MSTLYNQLDNWENTRLLPAVAEGDVLLGDLGYTDDDLRELGRLFADTVFYHVRHGTYTIDKGLEQIESQWPLTFALYLVLEGVHNYRREESEYWHGPKEVLGVENTQTARVGQSFLRTLTRFNLPAFENAAGHRYVTRILLHSGVPNDALEELFDFLFRNETRLHEIALDAHSLLALWRKDPETFLSGLSRPVARFLRYGGLVADDFVDRCLDLLRAADEDAAREAGLPERVLDAYWPWRARHAAELAGRAPGTRVRLQRPYLTVAPYNEGVTLLLPAQQFPNRLAPEKLVWILDTGDDHPRRIPTERQRIENGYQFTVTQTVAVDPAAGYTLELQADETKSLQRWDLPGITTQGHEQPPVLVFDPYDAYEADALDGDERWRPGERWLLYPRDAMLRGPSADVPTQEMPRLAGAWSAFRLETRVLSPGDYKLEASDGRTLCQFTITREEPRRRPILEGGERPLADQPGEEIALYSGTPPDLLIYSAQAGRWRLTVRAAGNATPSGVRSFCVLDLPHTVQEGVTRIRLSEADLMGRKPVGKFELTVRGPIGRSRVFALRVVPFLAVERSRPAYIDPPDETAEFVFKCDAASTISPNPPQDGMTLEPIAAEGHRACRIAAAPSVTQLTLLLAHETGVHVPLNIPVPRLRWRMVTGEDAPPWETRPMTVFPDLLGPEAALHVALPQLPGGPPIALGWQLLDSAGLVRRSSPPDRRQVTGRHRLSLAEFRDVWHELDDTLCCRLQLAVDGRDDLVEIDVLFLSPRLELGDMASEWSEEGDHIRLTILWQNPIAGRLQLRLWPLDRPWENRPLVPATQQSADYLEAVISKFDFPAEAYLAEIVAYNPWESRLPQPPQPDNPNTVLIKPPGLAAHYDELTARCDAGTAEPAELIALLMHQFHNNRRDAMHDTTRAIGQCMTSMEPIWLIRSLDAAATLNDATAYRLMRLHLLKPDCLSRFSEIGLSDELLARLLRHFGNDWPSYIQRRIATTAGGEIQLRALQSLCRAPADSEDFVAGVDKVLAAVSDGALHVNRAVELLAPQASAAAAILADRHTQDATELLGMLAEATDLPPSWVAKGIVLETDYGRVVVQGLRDRRTNRPLQCAGLSAAAYVDGMLVIRPAPTSVRLDLANRLLSFNRHVPFRCPGCGVLFATNGAARDHTAAEHPGAFLTPKKVSRDERLTILRPNLPDPITDSSPEVPHA